MTSDSIFKESGFTGNIINLLKDFVVDVLVDNFCIKRWDLHFQSTSQNVWATYI